MNELKRSRQMDATKTKTANVIAHVVGAATAVLVFATLDYFFPLSPAMPADEVKLMATLAAVAYVVVYHMLTPAKKA
jgi:hypothetical protein